MLRARSFQYLQLRFKSKKIHWSELQRKKFAKDKALENFDNFYGSIYGKRWKNIRVALLTEHKYIALVNNFGELGETSRNLENDGAINVKSLIDVAKTRLNDSKFVKKAAPYMVGKTIEKIIEKQENIEISSLYPKNSEQIPEKIIYSDESSSSITNDSDDIQEQIINYKKPLEKSIKEHSEIDESRIIDPEIGSSGALYDFIPATKIKGMEDWIPESDYYKYYSTTEDFPLKLELEKEFIFPENLNLYTYEMGNCSEFISPKLCLSGVLSHFLMDGGSILPPLFLNIEPGDKVLDACAAPGGKSLLMLQTLYPDILQCNDVQESRTNRILKVLLQYLPDYKDKWRNKRCLVTQIDARKITEYEIYDKILVDVPCTTDRHAVTENDNNIFKPARVKERLRLPELQSEILTNCLRLLKPGGSLVYSTCSLSPVQNDGVVHMALQKAFNEHGITTTIKDLSVLVKLFSDIFKFENSRSLKYGQMVLPYLPANFGPMYFCKIERNP